MLGSSVDSTAKIFLLNYTIYCFIILKDQYLTPKGSDQHQQFVTPPRNTQVTSTTKMSTKSNADWCNKTYMETNIHTYTLFILETIEAC